MPLNLVLMKSTPQSFPIIDIALPGAVAITTARGCADPADPYDGFNACSYTGDSEAHTDVCRAVAAACLGLASPELLIMPRQTHTARVEIVGAADAGRTIADVDALVTSDPSIAVGISTADCVPLLMADAEAGVVAAVHSGWRGTVGRIASMAVDAMISLGASPERIRCAFGPCICAGCFEVGNEVADVFAEAGFGNEVKRSFGIKPHVNLVGAVSATLRESGVSAVPQPPVGCSRCNPELFFSARRLGTASGRTLTAIRVARRTKSLPPVLE